MIAPAPTEEEAVAIFTVLLGVACTSSRAEPTPSPWRRAAREPDRTFDELRVRSRSNRVL